MSITLKQAVAMQAVANSSEKIPAVEVYDLACSQKSLEIFDDAVVYSHIPCQLDHISILASNTLSGAFSIAGKILWIGLELIPTARSIYNLQGKNALYHFLNVIVLNPLQVITKILSTIIRVAFSILGIIIADVSLQAFRVAEIIDIFILKAKAELFNFISQGEIVGTETTSDIDPVSATLYFNKKECIALLVEKRPKEELQAQDRDILENISKFTKFMLERDQKRAEALFFFRQIKQNKLVGHDDMKPILEKLFRTSTTIESLPEKIQSFTNAEECKKLYEHITRELILPESDDAQKEEDSIIQPFLKGANALFNKDDPKGLSCESNPLNFKALFPYFKRIDSLISARFGFGRMTYQIH